MHFLEYGTRWHIPLNDWDTVIAELVEKQLNLGCCLRLQFRNKLEFAQGTCRECGALLVFKNPKCEDDIDGFVSIAVNFLKPIDSSQHTGKAKRKIKKAVRLSIKSKLNAKTPLKLHEEMVLENKSSLSPLIPNIDVIQKIATENSSGDVFERDEFYCLRKLNQSQRHYGLIKYLCEIPDYVNIFFSKNQENVVKNSENFIFSIDATGSVVHSPIRYESTKYEIVPQKYKPVFLYLLMLSTLSGEMSVPVSQMLSSDHSTEACIKWLKIFVCSTKNHPIEVRLDCSSMLMRAVSLAFNNCNTIEYLHKCYESISTKKLQMKTMIRLDKSHIVKIFSKWKTWSEGKYGLIVKKFYINILRSLISEDDFQNVKDVCRHMIKIMISEYENDDLSLSFHFIHNYVSHKHLNNLEDSREDVDDTSKDDSYDLLPESSSESKEFWIETLFKEMEIEVSKNIENTKLNAYYVPKFKSDILRIMKLIPMWSNILLPLSNHTHQIVSTTGALESQFNVIKNNVFKYKTLPTKSHTFITQLMEHVEAQIIMFNDKLRNFHLHKSIKLTKSRKVVIKSHENSQSEYKIVL